MSSPSGPSTGLPDGVDISQLFDSFFYGSVVSVGLFGVTVVQTWTYINTNTDGWSFRTVVACLFLLDLATTCIHVMLLHLFLVTHFGDLNLLNLQVGEQLLTTEILLTAVVILVADLFFASRVYLLNQVHHLVFYFIVITSIIAGIISVGSVAIAFDVTALVKDGLTTSKEEIIVGVENGFCTVSEMSATLALCWSLRSSRTGVKRTDTILQRLFTYTVTRGLLLSVVQVLSMILYLAQPTKLTWVGFHLTQSKVYAITMISMLIAFFSSPIEEELMHSHRLNSRHDLRLIMNRTITDTDVREIVESSGNDEYSVPRTDFGAAEPTYPRVSHSPSHIQLSSFNQNQSRDRLSPSLHSVKAPEVVISREKISAVNFRKSVRLEFNPLPQDLNMSSSLQGIECYV